VLPLLVLGLGRLFLTLTLQHLLRLLPGVGLTKFQFILMGQTGELAMYNGDIKKNVAANFNQFLQAAYKIGFNVLVVNCMDESLNDSAEEVQALAKDEELVYDEVLMLLGPLVTSRLLWLTNLILVQVQRQLLVTLPQQV
jgi:hypothetical protein